MLLLRGLIALLLAASFVALLVPMTRNVVAYMYGPFLHAPRWSLERKPRPRDGLVRRLLDSTDGALRWSADALEDFVQVFPRLVALYLSFGIITVAVGGGLLGFLYRDVSQASLQTANFALLAGGIAIVGLMRVFSVLQSTSPLVWASFYMVGIVGIYLPTGTVVFGPRFLCLLTDDVLQLGVTGGMARLSAVVDLLVVPGLVLSIAAISVSEAAVALVQRWGLNAVPLSLFEEYRETFLLHEQRFSRRRVIGLYLERLRALEGWLARGEEPGGKIEVLWATYSATKEILLMLHDLAVRFPGLKVQALVRASQLPRVREFLPAPHSARFELHRVDDNRLPCPRFMVIGKREVVASMPVPPRDLERPTEGPSNIAFRSELPDCVARFERVFRNLS